MKQAAMLLAALVLAGCGTPQSEIIPTPITIEKPVSVSCIKEMPIKPEFPDTDAALKSANGIFGRAKMLVAGRLLRIAYEAKMEAALAACK
jgi:hypothetical protein